jgi:hypothetical protein
LSSVLSRKPPPTSTALGHLPDFVEGGKNQILLSLTQWGRCRGTRQEAPKTAIDRRHHSASPLKGHDMPWSKGTTGVVARRCPVLRWQSVRPT